MSPKKPYDDIPGTVVFDSDRAAEGYHLNQFCISLRVQANRDAFKADPTGYIDRYPMTADQREAALNQEWNRMLELGGNIYYTSKLAAFHVSPSDRLLPFGWRNIYHWLGAGSVGLDQTRTARRE